MTFSPCCLSHFILDILKQWEKHCNRHTRGTLYLWNQSMWPSSATIPFYDLFSREMLKFAFFPLVFSSTEFHVNVLNHPVTSVVSDTVSLLELRNRLQFGNPKRRESSEYNIYIYIFGDCNKNSNTQFFFSAIKAAGKITKNALSGRNVRFVTSMPPSK